MVSISHVRRTRRGLLAERGQALVEAAITIPILLLISVGIFEFGRAYQTWQVLTNASREGARIAILPGSAADSVRSVAQGYMQSGQLPHYNTATVDVTPTTILVNGNNVPASQVTVQYPFDFVVLGPVARLVSPQTTLGGNLTMVASTVMRNE